MKSKYVALAFTGAVAFSQVQQASADAMQGMDHSTMASAEVPASTKAYEAAMAVMMKNMMVPYTGDVDVDFIRRHDPASPGRHRHGKGRPAVFQGSGNPQAGAGRHHRPGKRDRLHERLACKKRQVNPGVERPSVARVDLRRAICHEQHHVIRVSGPVRFHAG